MFRMPHPSFPRSYILPHSSFPFPKTNLALSRSISEHARLVRIPVHTDEKIKKIDRAIKYLESKNGYTPNDEEISEYLNMPIDQIIYAKKSYYTSSTISLNMDIRDDDDASIEDFIEALNNKNIEIEHEEISNGLYEACAYLRANGADPIAVKKLFSDDVSTYSRKAQIVSSVKNLFRNSTLNFPIFDFF